MLQLFLTHPTHPNPTAWVARFEAEEAAQGLKRAVEALWTSDEVRKTDDTDTILFNTAVYPEAVPPKLGYA